MSLNLDLFSEAPTRESIRPFLKWAGGKMRLLREILPHLPAGGRLIEPFVGSAAVALNAPHEKVVAADTNADLIALYRDVQWDAEAVIREAADLFSPPGNTAERFYALRNEFNSGATGSRRSALFIYLNRHGFNGLCRYNARGEFNVPFGRYKAPALPVAAIRRFAHRAASFEFIAADFEEVMERARAGDVIYCDPPYVPLSSTASFTSYASGDFGPDDQKRLVKAAQRASRRGATVVLSNHATTETRRLYASATTFEFPVQRMISADGSNRWAATEILAVFTAQ